MMNKIVFIATTLICFFLACNQCHSESDYWNHLPESKGSVNDFEDIYTDGQERILDSIILSYNSKADIRLAIVTIDSTKIARDRFDSLILKMGNKWGVGEKGKDNGIIIGISKGYKRMRIENGFGIEKRISNEQTQIFIQNGFIPSFKKGDYFDGTINGLNAIMEYLLQEKQQSK